MKRTINFSKITTAISVFLFLVLLAMTGSACLCGAEKKQAKYELSIVEKGWRANPQDVKKVLHSTGDELWKYFPNRKLPKIIVHPKGGPIVLFKKGENGEITMKLSTGKTFWSQYAYQFAHEFCHILCDYDTDKHGNKWFEESLCEMASIFALRKMSKTWKTSPPYPHWKSYHSALSNYAQTRIQGYPLKKGETLAAWYKRHANALHNTAVKRDLNTVVAVALLPLFEKEPQHWRAVTWLNSAKPKRLQTLKEYLTDWHHHVPKEHKAFVKKIAKKFEITISDKVEKDTSQKQSDRK